MIFTSDHIRLIAAGKKTETRRLYKGLAVTTSVRIRVKGAGTVVRRPFIPTVGKSIAVQPGYGEPELFRVDVTAVRREPLGAITHEGAKAEGYPQGVAAFAKAWLAIHEPGWPRLEPVFCPTCTLDADHPSDELPPCPTCDGTTEIKIRPIPTADEVLARFRDRHGDRTVWVITFELNARERGRYLSDRPPSSAGQDDYTTSPRQTLMGGHHTDHRGRLLVYPEPEVCDPATVRSLTAGARAIGEHYRIIAQVQRKLDRDLLALEQRMVDARRAASLSSVDVRGELRALERMLADGAKPDALLRQVKRIESKVDRTAA